MKMQNQLYRAKAKILKAMAHPLRLAVIDFLRDGPRCVCDITKAVGAQRSNISRHLALMESAGIVESEKKGLMVFYCLKTPCITNFFSCVEGVLRSNLRQSNQLLSKL